MAEPKKKPGNKTNKPAKPEQPKPEEEKQAKKKPSSAKTNPLWMLEGFANAGQPPLYETPEDLKERILAYFMNCYSRGKYKATISGLTSYLGFKHRQSLDDQRKRSTQFSDIIDSAKKFIESCYESEVYNKNPLASWVLSNMDRKNWRNKTEIVNLPPEQDEITTFLQDATEEELAIFERVIARKNSAGTDEAEGEAV